MQPADEWMLKFKENWYRYEFKESPRQYDPIIRLIIKVIRELNRKHYDSANANIKVLSTTEEEPIWPPGKVPSGNCVKRYTFTQEYQEFPMTVDTKVVRARGPLTAERIHVRLGISKVWKPIREFLLMIPDPSLTVRTPFEKTRHWWEHNGRSFRFMDLPVEVRAIVFEYALGPEVYPRTTARTERRLREGEISDHDPEARQDARIVFGFGYSNKLIEQHSWGLDYFREIRPITSGPNTAVLRLNKQLHKEALEAGWQATKKYFVEWQIFTKVVDSKVGPMAQYNCLTRIQLDFTNATWFQFFGLKVVPQLRLEESESMGRYLQASKLPNLRHLDMRFRDPDGDESYGGCPWKSAIADGWANDFTAFNCCQSTVVDLICAAAFPYVHHIPFVKVIGFVKHDMKVNWEYIYSHSTTYDRDFALEIISSMRYPDRPPPCSCRKLCKISEVDLDTEWGDFTSVWEYPIKFDFGDEKMDNETLRRMGGYGGHIPETEIHTLEKRCYCGCGRPRSRVYCKC